MKRALVLVCLLVSFTHFFAPITKISTSNHVPAAARIELTIDFGNGTELVYSQVEAETVLDAIRNVTSVEVDWYGDRAFVTSIAGVTNEAETGLWWQYWVNGHLGSVAANKYDLNDNDTVAWRRIPPEYTAATQNSSDPLALLALIILPIIGISAILGMYIRRHENDQQNNNRITNDNFGFHPPYVNH
ncbi:MAG: DUF4430 domain-containing protein [Candidatus Thorarchaeota archaeon]